MLNVGILHKIFSVVSEGREIGIAGGPSWLSHGGAGAGGGGGAGGAEARGSEGLVQHGPEDGEGLQGPGDAQHGAVLEEEWEWRGGGRGRGLGGEERISLLREAGQCGLCGQEAEAQAETQAVPM